MSNYLVDQVADIAARVKELQAEKDEAIKGTSAPVDGQEQKTEDLPHGYGYFTGVATGGTGSLTIATADLPPYTPSMGSLAHPNWPYAGTGFEWRKFVRS